MIQGSVPLLTKGPLALFLGGEKMLEILDDRQPGNHLFNVLIFSVFFQIFILSFKTIRNKQLQSITRYAQNLRNSLVKNALNIYGIICILSFQIIAFILFLRYISTISIQNMCWYELLAIIHRYFQSLHGNWRKQEERKSHPYCSPFNLYSDMHWYFLDCFSFLAES